jgi:MATE family multidrug resistance protein
VEVGVLGRSPPEQLGGAAIGRSLSFVGMSLGLGIAAALEPLAAQAVGAREPRTAWSAFTATLAAGTLVAIPSGIAEVASTWLLGPLGVAPELVMPARAFAIAQAPSLALATAFFAAKTYLQAHGKTSPAVIAAVIANVVNFFACGLLVLGDDALTRAGLPALGLPALGALGAGIANTIANVVLAVAVLVPAWRLRPDPPVTRTVTLRTVLRLGTPVGLQLLAEIGVFAFVSVLAGRLGTVAVSAHQIAIGLASFTFMGALGISGATAIRVGHAVGEGRSPMRAGLTGIALGAAFMTVCGIFFVSMPGALVGAFTEDHAIATLGARLLVIAAAFQLFDGVQGVAAGALRGAGDVRFPFVANLGAHWFVGLPLALLLAFHMGWGTPGLWYGLLVGLAVVAILLAWRFVAVARARVTRV